MSTIPTISFGAISGTKIDCSGSGSSRHHYCESELSLPFFREIRRKIGTCSQSRDGNSTFQSFWRST